MGDEPLVSQEEMASVLSTGDEAPAGDAGRGDGESGAYSLRRPVAIAPDDEPAARRRVERLTEILCETLRKELEVPIAMELQGFQQLQAGAALESMPPPAWVVGLAHGGAGGVALVLDAATALLFVELALGGQGRQATEGREPTPLEHRVMGNLAGELARVVGPRAELELSSGAFDVGRIAPSIAAPGETVGAALLKIELHEASRSARLLVSAGLLKPRVEESLDRGRIGPIAARLERVPVDVRPVLQAGTVHLQDLVGLEPDAVLALEAPATTTLELRVAGQTLFSGRIAKQEDRPSFAVEWRRGDADAAEAEGADAPATEQTPAPQEEAS